MTRKRGGLGMKYKIYKCTSSYQKDFLLERGIEFIWADIDVNKITFWLFDKTDEFQRIVKQYKNLK